MAEAVIDLDWMKKLLFEEEIGHLALCDEHCNPYVLPINYAYIDDQIVLHCAMTGHKLDLIRNNPACCFVVDRHADRVKYHPEKQCHYRYHSVMVYGRARFVESAKERLEWIHRYRDYFNQRLDWTMASNDNIATAARCGIILIEIESMTGRREEGHDKNADKSVDKK